MYRVMDHTVLRFTVFSVSVWILDVPTVIFVAALYTLSFARSTAGRAKLRIVVLIAMIPLFNAA